MRRVVTKKNTYLLLLLVISLLGLAIIPTYAKFPSNYITDEDIVGMSLDFNIGISNIEEYEEIIVSANSSEQFNIEIENISSDTMYYGIWYRMIEPNEITDDIAIGRMADTEITTSGPIESDATKTVVIGIINNSGSDIKIAIGVATSNTSTSDIEYLNGKQLITGTSTASSPNAPNLDSGNLIPVYYDNTNEVWKKADSNNTNNSWYDYNNKMWANAILVSDETARSTYQSASVGATITDSDITAFYVWIPRFKYRVWNITRQAGDESTYAYPAFTEGIDIIFERGTESTDNVECTYNTATTESTTNLSDTCVYNGTDTITTTSSNANYTDAWYTHPAFTFGTEALTGFWMGKFETSGTAEAPKILPDVSSLRNQTISTQFTTAKVFQNYLSNDIDAHMLTNLEWGAATYLTHSMHGLCDNSGCRDVYMNNSTEFYTGRSGGAIAGSDNLHLGVVYPSDSSADTYNSTTGYYNYKGYFFNYSGSLTTTKNISKIASNTGNVTGVYDMSGGAYDYVMANMVSSSNAFNPASSGTSWSGSSTLASKYYHGYSYGTANTGQLAMNRTRLGDATAEAMLKHATSGAWRASVPNSYSASNFIYNTDSQVWIGRGGYASSEACGVFGFSKNTGGAIFAYSFRSSLS